MILLLHKIEILIRTRDVIEIKDVYYNFLPSNVTRNEINEVCLATYLSIHRRVTPASQPQYAPYVYLSTKLTNC